MNQRSGNGPNPAPGYAPDWFGRPAIFSLACLLAIAVIALAFTSGKGGPALYVTAVAALLLIAAAVWLWWPAQAGPIPLRDALAAIRDFPSPLGTYSFDENRNPLHTPQPMPPQPPAHRRRHV